MTEIADYLANRNALFRNPTPEAARKAWDAETPIPPPSPDVPLATVHKARLQWLDATDSMLAESLAWLAEHGFEATFKSADPLTPESRDAQRAALGKPPLKGER